MTYGEVSARLRETMIWLLERRRVIQQLGGPGSYRIPVTSTETQREVTGREIRAYRGAVLAYCVEAVRAVTPTAELEGPERMRNPVVGLRWHLERTYAAHGELLVLSTVMAARPSYELVARWRDAARSAIEGEREIAALGREVLTLEQQRTIAKDAADLVRALVSLDVRYKNVPGWTFLHEKVRLQHVATAASDYLAAGTVDLAVDNMGWRPAPGLIEGPALPGLAGVLQAQHNVAVDLAHFPSALNLRHVLIGQAELSQRAAQVARATESPTASSFEERAGLYRQMVTASRTLGGEIGGGRLAAAESAAAARRIPSGLPAGGSTEEMLARLAHLNDRIDVKIATALEHGFRERLYLTAITLPAIGRPGQGGIARAARKYVGVDHDRPSELLQLARARLRPPHTPATPSVGSDEKHRTTLAAAIAATPGARERPAR